LVDLLNVFKIDYIHSLSNLSDPIEKANKQLENN